jgi:hypothetical protein
MANTEEIDSIAIKYHKTKDPYYKDLWYKKIKEFANGPHNIKRRFVSSGFSNQTDDGRCRVI